MTVCVKYARSEGHKRDVSIPDQDKGAHVRKISHCKVLSTGSASSNKAIRVTYQTISDCLERSQVGDLARIDDRGTNWNLWDAYIR